MALRKRGKWRYGDDHVDLRTEIVRYSREVGYAAQHFADCTCTCGGKAFTLLLDDEEGVAVRVCEACGADHPIGDSAEFMGESEEEECACPCVGESFQITVGVALYAKSDDVRWLYVGCRCVACGLTAVYGDWKCEGGGYENLLARV